jgi:hypothetical protein
MDLALLYELDQIRPIVSFPTRAGHARAGPVARNVNPKLQTVRRPGQLPQATLHDNFAIVNCGAFRGRTFMKRIGISTSIFDANHTQLPREQQIAAQEIGYDTPCDPLVGNLPRYDDVFQPNHGQPRNRCELIE